MAFMPPSAIAEEAVGLGKAKTLMGWGRLLVLGFLAGAYIAFGSQLAVTTAAGIPWIGLQKLIFGAVFPVGLMLVVIAGSELFTGNCMLPVIACLQKKGRWRGLAKNWLGSYIGNFAGAVFCAYFLAVATGLFLTEPWYGYISSIAQTKCSLSFAEAFWRGVGCNWLVCLAVWLAIGSEDIVGKVFAIQFPIMAFVALGFEHSVANMFFIPAGIFATNAVTWGAFLIDNLLPVTLGNIVGGGLFVAVIYWWVYLRL
ncbi:putative formate transporter 1 [subsurface metagenome]